MGGKTPKQEITEEERALAEVAAQKWERYKTAFAPAQEAYMAKVDALGTPQVNRYARGAASSSVTAQASQRPGLRLAASRGLNLNSGSVLADMADTARDTQSVATDTTLGAQLSAEDAYAGGLQAVAAMGQGQSSQAQAGMSDLARIASDEARTKLQTKLQERQARKELIGTLAGAATQAYGSNQAAKKAWFKNSNAQSGFSSLGDSDPFA